MVDLVVKKSYFVGSNPGVVETEYTMGKKLGDGAYGSVFLAAHNATGAVRAIKQIPKSRIRNPERLETEIQVMRECDHPNIVRLYEVYEDTRYVYLVIEHCEGGELFDYIVSKKRLNEKEAAQLFGQLLSSVRYLHSHEIVHRDLKPENLLFLGTPGEDPLIKLCDFGLAKTMSAQKRTMLTKAGSAFYIAPEVLDDQGYGSSCDIWSCGVILFILLSGRPPFGGKNDQEIFQAVSSGKYNMQTPEWKKISSEAKQFIVRMLSMDPASRPTAVEALRDRWFEVASASSSATGMQESFQNLKQFRASQKLQQAVMSFISAQLVSREDTRHLTETFRSLDVNGDGKLSREELLNGYRKTMGSSEAEVEVERIMREVDTDDNGYVEYSEFVMATMRRERLLSREHLDAAFHLFDVDGSGAISAKELRQILGADVISTDNVWRDLVQQVDVNGDGEIDLKEFKEMMLRLI